MAHQLIPTAVADPARARLDGFERQLADRERALAEFKAALQQLQTRYFADVGPLYAQLTELDHAVATAEIRAGLRPAASELADDGATDASSAVDVATGSCSNRSAPSRDLKKTFRDLAKALHPDLALDEPARCRRHSLMAEANRAYAERDEDRLRLIMRTWQRAPESAFDDGPDAARLRIERQVAEIETRMIQIDSELADLRSSAIGRLARRIEEARAQGWDLFAEMILQVKREVARATARLALLQRRVVR